MGEQIASLAYGWQVTVHDLLVRAGSDRPYTIGKEAARPPSRSAGAVRASGHEYYREKQGAGMVHHHVDLYQRAGILSRLQPHRIG